MGNSTRITIHIIEGESVCEQKYTTASVIAVGLASLMSIVISRKLEPPNDLSDCYNTLCLGSVSKEVINHEN